MTGLEPLANRFVDHKTSTTQHQMNRPHTPTSELTEITFITNNSLISFVRKFGEIPCLKIKYYTSTFPMVVNIFYF